MQSRKNNRLFMVIVVVPDLIVDVDELTKEEVQTHGFDLSVLSKGKEPKENPTKNRENVCFRGVSNGHLSHICQTLLYLCKLYDESVKAKEIKEI